MSGDIPNDRTWVSSLKVRDFRIYAEAEVELTQGFNVVEGPNGQGKTSLLEALYMLSTTKALRGSRDSEVVRDERDAAWVEAELAPLQTTIGMVVKRHGRKEAALNAMKLPKASDLIGRLPCVCVSLEDMLIVRGEPADRRQFLDLLLAQCSTAYLRAFTVYKRALEHRNALLRLAQDQPVGSEQFDAWEAQLAESGAVIRRERTTFLTEASPLAQERYADLSQRETLGWRYAATDESSDAPTLATTLASSRHRDTARGSTSVGPHRDDLELRLDGRPARTHGSLGQQRCAVLALKFATAAAMESRTGEPPLLLLDDVLSDLDASRRERLAEVVSRYEGQTVLTCTESAAAGPAILDRSRRFRVVEGTIAPSHG